MSNTLRTKALFKIFKRVLSLALLILITISMKSVKANEIWLIITNQYGEPINTKVRVVAIGGIAELYNETYWQVRTNLTTVLVKVYRFNICVGEFQLEPNSTYRLRVLVGDMLIRAPRSLILRVKLLGTNQSWLLTGESSYVIEDLPYGVYEIEIVGASFRKVVYWEGGTISIGRSYYIDLNKVARVALFIIIPALGTTTYTLARKYRRVRRKTRRKTINKSQSRYKKGELRKPRTLAEAILMSKS